MRVRGCPQHHMGGRSLSQAAVGRKPIRLPRLKSFSQLPLQSTDGQAPSKGTRHTGLEHGCLRRGFPYASHIPSCDGTVTGLGFPPSIFWIVLTIGHQSTDSILAGRQRGDRADVRKPLRAPLPRRLHGVTRGVAKGYGSQGRIQFHGPQGSGQDIG
jgi:hypothetical protein